MKKLMLILFVSLLLTACGEADYEGYTIIETEYNEQVDIYIEEELHISMPRPIFTTEQYLEDLDYMLYVMQNNFALFDVAHWAHGVDIYAIIDNIREAVIAEPDMAIDDFFDIFYRQFAPLRNIGHFNVIDSEQHNSILNEPDGLVWRRFFSDKALNRLRTEQAIAFYEPMHLDAQDWVEVLTTRLKNMTEQEIREFYILLYGQLTIRGQIELAEEIMQALISAEACEISRILTYINEALTENVTTRIIDDGRIAYLAIDSFMNYPIPSNEDRQIIDFLESVSDFDHLIIDLRFNAGGAPRWFYRTILEPNIDQAHTVEGFVFLSDGEYTAQYASINYGTSLGPVAGTFHSMDSNLRAVTQILETYNLPNLNLTDMERMDYGYRIQVTLNPRPHYPNFSYEPTFQGKVWFLTHSVMGSAAEIAARVVQDIGFATLVGDITGGNFGGERTIIALPNSGIAFIMDLNYVTDRHGRPLEAGTVPDFFNLEGMDALETALALIDREDADATR